MMRGVFLDVVRRFTKEEGMMEFWNTEFRYGKYAALGEQASCLFV